MAAAGVVLLIAHLLLAQLTLVLAGCLLVTGRIGRWRPAWLAVPAAAGLIWAVAIGPGRAVAGFTAGAGQLVTYLTGPGASIGRLLTRPAGAFSGWRQWLPRQLPVALIPAAAEAALLSLLKAWQPAAYRPGPVAAVRRRHVIRLAARGQVVTDDGVCLGVTESTGRRVCIRWQEASHGLLLAGLEAAALADTGLTVVTAAIQRRKAVIVVDLSGSKPLPAVIEGAARAAAAPAHLFGSEGVGYDPLAAAGPGQAADLTLALIDWEGASTGQRAFGTAYLTAAVQACAAAQTGLTGLDQLIAALHPGTLQSLAGQVPGYLPGREDLAARVADLTTRAQADPAPVTLLAGQLAGLRQSALGRCLGQLAGDTGISIRQVLRRREVATFALDRRTHGQPAAMIARLVIADLTAQLGERAESVAPADCLAWLHGCEVASPPLLRSLLDLGQAAGTTVLLSTSDGAVAAELAASAGVVLLRGPVPQALAGLPELAPTAAAADGTGLAAGTGRARRTRLAGAPRLAETPRLAGAPRLAGLPGLDGVPEPARLGMLGGLAQLSADGPPRRSKDLSLLVRNPPPGRRADGLAVEVGPAVPVPPAVPGGRLRVPRGLAFVPGMRAGARR